MLLSSLRPILLEASGNKVQRHIQPGQDYAFRLLVLVLLVLGYGELLLPSLVLRLVPNQGAEMRGRRGEKIKKA